MIKTCPNCGGLFCTPPDATFAGRACNCGYKEVVTLGMGECVERLKAVEKERDDLRTTTEESRIKIMELDRALDAMHFRAEKAEKQLISQQHSQTANQDWLKEFDALRERATKAEADAVELKTECACVSRLHAQMVEIASSRHFEITELQSKLSKLQHDVKPLVEIMEAAVGIVAKPVSANIMTKALETFLLKHPGLSQ